tara:strand:+ start:760 stop:1626 length:867 start_codon:yes stop_codon:yes gene_type:complete
MNWSKILKFYSFCLLTAISVCNAQAETIDQRTKVALRSIGHEFLLQLGDSTSLVLPIEMVNDRFVLRFEKQFSFEPTLLTLSTYKVFEKFDISEKFIVEVSVCDSSAVMYSFEADLTKNKDDITCKLRELPLNCYTFYFTEIENREAETSDIIAKDNPPKYSWVLILCILLVVIGVVLLVLGKKKSSADNNFIPIGQFQFDQKGMTLNLRAQSIELSSKESDLLFLLYSNENKTLEREFILNKVWGDDGDYVGRTLDVFISKLRKKLEADANIKIVNVRGVGYRLVIN